MQLLERIGTASTAAELQECQEEYDRQKSKLRSGNADRVCCQALPSKSSLLLSGCHPRTTDCRLPPADRIHERAVHGK